MSTPHLLCLQTGRSSSWQPLVARCQNWSLLITSTSQCKHNGGGSGRQIQCYALGIDSLWIYLLNLFFFFYFLTHWNSTSMVLEHPIWIATATERVTAEENLFSWLQMFTLFHNIVYLGLYTTPDLHPIYIPHWFLFPFRYRVVGCCRASWRSVNYRRHFHMLRADAIIKKYMKFVISVFNVVRVYRCSYPLHAQTNLMSLWGDGACCTWAQVSRHRGDYFNNVTMQQMCSLYLQISMFFSLLVYTVDYMY